MVSASEPCALTAKASGDRQKIAKGASGSSPRLELDINFIDTADSYGPHVNEELIAEAVVSLPAGLVIAPGRLEPSRQISGPSDASPSTFEAFDGSLRTAPGPHRRLSTGMCRTRHLV